jgi:RIO kinase 1
MAKKSREKWKTYEGVFDEFTHRNLFKLISRGHFEGLIGPISIGKEANVYSARTKDGKKVAVKIYRLETCDFNRMYDYIKYDPDFMGIKKQRRKVVFAWARREFHNLIKARELHIRVPKPITVLNNVLVMEFIGKNEAARKLKDDIPEDLDGFFKKVIKYMKILYKNKLVHSDLSAYNILNFNNNPVFIDLSQLMSLSIPVAREHMERDIRNIAKFFKKYGIKTNPEDLKKRITKKN